MVINLIISIFFISILALGVFCLVLVAFLIQLILNFLVANILPIVLIIFGLFALLVTLAIFLPKSEETQSNIENKKDKEINSQCSTAKVSNTESYVPKERSLTYYSDFSEIRSELRGLKLFPSQSIIQSGETIQFKLTGLDKFNNQIEISERISWSATAGKIDSTGLFSIYSIDNVLVRVTAKVGTLKTTSTVKIESIYEILEVPQLKSLKVVPDCVYLKPDKEQVFEAIGLDRHNNPIDCGEIIWSATGGIIDQNGKLIASNNAKGVYQVTATSKHTPKHNAAAKTTLLTLGVSTRILSWAIANEEFFYDVLAPLLNLTNEDDSLSEADALVQSWILEIGRRRVAKLLKKASNLSFKEAFSNISDSIDYIVVPELRKIEFVNLPSNVKPGDRIKPEVIGLDVNPKKQENKCCSNDNKTRQNASTSTNEHKKTQYDSQSSSPKPQSNSSNSSQFNDDSLESNCNSSSDSFFY